jgi:hypothetical protein
MFLTPGLGMVRDEGLGRVREEGRLGRRFMSFG